jgi:hypothetical protein
MVDVHMRERDGVEPACIDVRQLCIAAIGIVVPLHEAKIHKHSPMASINEGAAARHFARGTQ